MRLYFYIEWRITSWHFKTAFKTWWKKWSTFKYIRVIDNRLYTYTYVHSNKCVAVSKFIVITIKFSMTMKSIFWISEQRLRISQEKQSEFWPYFQKTFGVCRLAFQGFCSLRKDLSLSMPCHHWQSPTKLI